MCLRVLRVHNGRPDRLTLGARDPHGSGKLIHCVLDRNAALMNAMGAYSFGFRESITGLIQFEDSNDLVDIS